MDALNSGVVLVGDEIEVSMHPLLTRHLIEMIQDQTINQNQAQLIQIWCNSVHLIIL